MNHTTSLRRLGLQGLVALCGSGLTACDDGLTESPPHILVADNLFLDRAGFDAGLNALYAQVRDERIGTEGSGGANDLRTKSWQLATDVAWGNDIHNRQLGLNMWGAFMNAEFGAAASNWSWLYETINAANTIIGRAENPKVKWTEAEKNRVLAEARMIRAWAYRHLTFLFGDVPLNLEESSGESIRTDWERTPVAQVREQMEKDMLFAEQHLPNVPKEGRVGKAVARHFLAEHYLVLNQPAKAEQSAEAVVNSGDYRLITQRYGVRANQPGVPFMDQFIDGNVNRSQGNTEALWTLQHQLNVPGGGASLMRRDLVNAYWQLGGLTITEEYGGRGIGRDMNTRWAINNYEPQDDRGSHHAIRKFYLYNTTSGLPAGKRMGDTLHLKWDRERFRSWDWPSTRKWDWADPVNPSGSRTMGDQPYVRLAETLLLLAEAEMKLGKLTEAAEHLNVVRRRSKASEVGPAQVTLDFILDERARELLTEEHRRYTLLRTGKWLERTRLHNPISGPFITDRDKLYPIPQSVIDANLGRKMEQNPGY